MADSEQAPPVTGIVSAVGIVARSGSPRLGKLLEEAMSAAVLKCAEEGITDPDEIRARMLAWRDRTKEAYRKAEAEAAERLAAPTASSN